MTDLSPDFGQLVKQFLHEHQDEMVAFLSKLVLMESPSSEPDSQAQILNVFRETLQALDFQVTLIQGQKSGGHLHAQPRGLSEGVPRQLLLGHCDTVWPIGTLNEMPLIVNDNTLSGPGAYDMKAGLTQMVFALRTLQALNLSPHVCPELFINSDEEIGSQESTPYIRRLAQEADRAFILEPSLGLNGRLKTVRKGVGRYRVEVSGRAAHAGLDPDKGISAVLELSHVIQKLFALNDPANGVSVNVGMVQGGLRPNVIAPASSAVVDVRVPTREDAHRVEKAILALEPETPGTSLHIEGGINRWPLEPTAANRKLWNQATAAADQLALDLEEGTAGGGSDGNTTSQFTATLDGLGAVGDGAHAQHEFVYLDRMVERAGLLAVLLLAPPLNSHGHADPRIPLVNEDPFNHGGNDHV